MHLIHCVRALQHTSLIQHLPSTPLNLKTTMLDTVVLRHIAQHPPMAIQNPSGIPYGQRHPPPQLSTQIRPGGPVRDPSQRGTPACSTACGHRSPCRLKKDFTASTAVRNPGTASPRRNSPTSSTNRCFSALKRLYRNTKE